MCLKVEYFHVIVDFNGLSGHLFWLSTSESPLLLEGWPPRISRKVNLFINFREEELHLREMMLSSNGTNSDLAYLGYEISILTDNGFNVDDVYSKMRKMQHFPLNHSSRELFAYQPGRNDVTTLVLIPHIFRCNLRRWTSVASDMMSRRSRDSWVKWWRRLLRYLSRWLNIDFGTFASSGVMFVKITPKLITLSSLSMP